MFRPRVGQQQSAQQKSADRGANYGKAALAPDRATPVATRPAAVKPTNPIAGARLGLGVRVQGLIEIERLWKYYLRCP